MKEINICRLRRPGCPYFRPDYLWYRSKWRYSRHMGTILWFRYAWRYSQLYSQIQQWRLYLQPITRNTRSTVGYERTFAD